MKEKNRKLLTVDKNVRTSDVAIINEIEEVNEKVGVLATKIDSIEIPIPEKVIVPDHSLKLEEILEEVKKKEEITDLQISPELKAELKGEPGKDYILTNEDKAEIASGIKVPVVKEKTIVEKTDVIHEVPIVKEVAVTDTPKVIAEKINTLEKEIDFKVLKNVPEFSKKGGVIHRGGSKTFLDLNDAPNTYTGQAAKVVKVKATEDGLEFGDATDTDEKVKYDVNDPTAGYIADKFVAGPGITLSEGTGADENKLEITNSAPDQTVAITDSGIANVTGTYPNFNIDVPATDISGKLNIDQTTPQTITATDTTITASDEIYFGDVTDSSKFKKDTVQGILDLVPTPDLSAYVPYTGATTNVDLGNWDLTGAFLTGQEVNASRCARAGTIYDDGFYTPSQIYGGFYDVADPTGFTANPTYSTYVDLYGSYDAGSYVDTSAGSLIDTGFYVSFYGYRIIGGEYYFDTYYFGSAYLSDYSSTNFQLQLAWGDWGGDPQGPDGYIVEVVDENTYDGYWLDVGLNYSTSTGDFMGWNYGYAPIYNSLPYYEATGGQSYYDLLLYAYKTTDGVKVYSANPEQIQEYDINYEGFMLDPTWDDVSADGYILYDQNSGYWIDVGNVLTYNVDGYYMGWEIGSPDIVVPYAQDLIHAYNDTYDFYVKGNGQIVSPTPQGVKPLDITSTTLNTNLNADLLDGLHASSFVQNVTATLPLSVSGTTTKNVSLAWNTTNLQNTSNQLNTIQNINTTASPQFSNLTLSTTNPLLNITGTGTAVRLQLGTSSTNTITEGIVRQDFLRTATDMQSYRLGCYGNYFGLYTGLTTNPATRIWTIDGVNKRFRFGDNLLPTETFELLGNESIYGNLNVFSPTTFTKLSTYYEDTDTASNNIFKKAIQNEVLQYQAENYYLTPSSAGTLSADINLGQTFSIAFTTYGSASGQEKIITKTSGGNAVLIYTSQFSFYGGSSTTVQRYAATSTSGINRWVVTRNGGTLQIYKNGVSQTLLGTGTISGDFIINEFFTNFRQGVDEFVTFNTALTQAEVTADYNGGLFKRYGILDSNVTHIYHFDENSSGIAYDLFGSNISVTGTYTRNMKSANVLRYPANLLSSYSDYNYDGLGYNTIGDHFVNTKIRGNVINSDLPITNNISVLATLPYKICPVVGGAFASTINTTYNVFNFWTHDVSDFGTHYVITSADNSNYLAFVNGTIKAVKGGVTVAQVDAGEITARHNWFIVWGGQGNSEIAIFKDTVVLVNNKGLSSMASNSWARVLCGSSGDVDTAFSGCVDELVIWATNTQGALPYLPGDGSVITKFNTPQVVTAYNEGDGYYWSSGDDRPPHYIYHFDEGSGTTCASSGTSNTITFGTAPTWESSIMARNRVVTERNVITKEGYDSVADINTLVFGDVNVNMALRGANVVANGTYTVGIGATQNGTITITDGIITAIQEAI